MSLDTSNGEWWILLPWALFAVAAGHKFWRITRTIRHRSQSRPSSTEQFRQSLERLWQNDHS
ncbi:MAG: hypothetical protein EBZ51_09135 [Synechococcaceae bacterium WB9_2_112]|jgi:hypothetical protein|nr:hypothetical protein [Synechococcaceae bacterium WB9_2_112]